MTIIQFLDYDWFLVSIIRVWTHRGRLLGYDLLGYGRIGDVINNKQVAELLLCVCSVKDHKKTSKCGKNISDTLGYRSSHILTSF